MTERLEKKMPTILAGVQKEPTAWSVQRTHDVGTTLRNFLLFVLLVFSRVSKIGTAKGEPTLLIWYGSSLMFPSGKTYRIA
jgi:hypothetical protein